MGALSPAQVAHETGRHATLKVLDLFAGAGGLSAGLQAAGGFHTVQAVEIDKVAARTYQENHRRTKVFAGSIQDWLTSGDIPDVDVIVGGPPCQGFSTLGKQDGEDDRNALWHEYAKTIARAKPKYFLVENVAVFLKSRQFADFRAETELGGMLEDYTFQAAVLNAADFGAYQSRRRAVLIGHSKDLEFPGWPLAKWSDHHRTVAQAFGNITTAVDGLELPAGTVTVDGREQPGVFTTDQLHISRHYEPISVTRFSHIPPEGNRFDLPDHLKAPCWLRHTSGSADVMGRLRWSEPSVTIRTEFFKPEKGRYLHPAANRAITHMEAAILQGFPMDYRWVGSKVAIARQIGNAVPVPLGRALGRALTGRDIADEPPATVVR